MKSDIQLDMAVAGTEVLRWPLLQINEIEENIHIMKSYKGGVLVTSVPPHLPPHPINTCKGAPLCFPTDECRKYPSAKPGSSLLRDPTWAPCTPPMHPQSHTTGPEPSGVTLLLAPLSHTFPTRSL